MKVLSYWAKTHQKEAVKILIVLKVLVPALAILLGLYYRNHGIYLPYFPVYIAFAFLMIGLLLYPEKRVQKQYYLKKSFDFLIVMSGFICSFLTINRTDIIAEKYAMAASIIKPAEKPVFENIIAKLKADPKAEITRAEKRVLRKHLKPELKKYVKYTLNGEKEDSKRTLLTILIIFGAVGLSALIAALACSLSCSGNDAFAILLAAGGLFLVIFFSIKLIKTIKRKYPKEGEVADPTQ